MSHLSSQSLLEVLNWRYATKKFDATRKIPGETWEALEQALVLAPSSFGLQPWKFLVVQDPKLRAELSAASWGQTQPIECSHYVIFLGAKNIGQAEVDHFISRTAEVRGIAQDSLSAYRNVILGSIEGARKAGTLDDWQAKQAYIAIGQFMTSAALLGVDTCPMEGFDHAKYNSILGIDTSKWAVLCACAAGYRSAEDKYASIPKVRYPKSELIQYR